MKTQIKTQSKQVVELPSILGAAVVDLERLVMSLEDNNSCIMTEGIVSSICILTEYVKLQHIKKGKIL